MQQAARVSDYTHSYMLGELVEYKESRRRHLHEAPYDLEPRYITALRREDGNEHAPDYRPIKLTKASSGASRDAPHDGSQGEEMLARR